jgi:hypothetical protein
MANIVLDGAAHARLMLAEVYEINQAAIGRTGDLDVHAVAAFLRTSLAQPAAQEDGFYLILADFLASALDGSVVDIEHLRTDWPCATAEG